METHQAHGCPVQLQHCPSRAEGEPDCLRRQRALDSQQGWSRGWLPCCVVRAEPQVCCGGEHLLTELHLRSGRTGSTAAPLAGELTECSEVALARCPRIPKLAPSRQKGSLPSCFSRLQLFATPWTIAQQAPLSMGFPRQDYWSGLPCPSPGDLPDPGIEPASPALADGFSTTETPGRPKRGSRGRQTAGWLPNEQTRSRQAG